MHTRHTHNAHTHAHPAQTEGNLIRWARYYDASVYLMTLGQASAIRRRTIELAQIQMGDRVLDVGCGTGDLTILAKEKAGVNGRVVGIDPSPEMVAVARHKAQEKGSVIEVQVGVVEAIPFPENSFDVVVSSLMMHHLPDNVKMQGLVEIQRVLRPNGHLLIVDFKAPTSFSSKVVMTLLMHGGMKSGVAELPTKLEKAGFHQINVGSLNLMSLGYVSAL